MSARATSKVDTVTVSLPLSMESVCWRLCSRSATVSMKSYSISSSACDETQVALYNKKIYKSFSHDKHETRFGENRHI